MHVYCQRGTLTVREGFLACWLQPGATVAAGKTFERPIGAPKVFGLKTSEVSPAMRAPWRPVVLDDDCLSHGLACHLDLDPIGIVNGA